MILQDLKNSFPKLTSTERHTVRPPQNKEQHCATDPIGKAIQPQIKFYQA